jgi:hypothetical protein
VPMQRATKTASAITSAGMLLLDPNVLISLLSRQQQAGQCLVEFLLFCENPVATAPSRLSRRRHGMEPSHGATDGGGSGFRPTTSRARIRGFRPIHPVNPMPGPLTGRCCCRSWRRS